MKSGKKALRRAVFLDRDGTINKLVYYPDHGFVDSPFVPSQLKLIPGAARALALLRKKGFLLVLVSNQPGVAKGNMTKKTFAQIDRKFDSLLAAGGASLDAKYYCPHHPHAKLAQFRKKCACRKPAPGLILRASEELGIDPKRSFMVGDGIVDVRAGKKAGCRTVFVGHFKPELWKYFAAGKMPDMSSKTLLEAARKMR
ncbi:Histidine biosynthesis bifunctional protein HisB [uncultured archaeon]|nr:Histidine biosynthesis bifunctional protein HisB [uncultured archaeon]